MLLDNKIVYEILVNKLKHDGFTVEETTWQQLHDGDGIMGEHFRLQCRVRLTNNPTPETHYFFVKRKSPEAIFEEIPEKVHRKEVATFRAFLAMDIPIANSGLPTCYYTDDVQLVMTDLVVDGYEIMTTQRVATDAELFCVLKCLAGIHAGCIVYEERKRAATGNAHFVLPDEFPEPFVELYMRLDSEATQKYYGSFMKGVINAIDVFGLPQVLSNGKKFKEEVLRFNELLAANARPSKRFRNSICQCDVWPANLFLRRHPDGRPLQAKIVDYQITRYQPPALDVLAVIALNTTREYRKQHLERLQAAYFKYFATYLKDNGVPPESVYTWEEFLASFEEIEFMALMQQNATIPLVYIEKRKKIEFLNSADCHKVMVEDRSPLLVRFADDEYYMARVKDCLLDLMDYFERH